MDKNPLFSERAGHYKIFKKISLMLKELNPLTLKNKIDIVDLAYNANKEGKRRQMTKLEYIKLLHQIHSS